MLKMREHLAIGLLFLGVSCASAGAQGNPQLAGDAQAINQACQADTATAGCGQDVVGKGLLKCLHAYHKAHPDYKVSAGCHDAIRKMKGDRHAAKAQSSQSAPAGQTAPQATPAPQTAPAANGSTGH